MSKKKICLALVGIYFSMFRGFGQSLPDTIYESKPLKLEEVNLVSSYYTQEGIHSAVTGGIGNEHVTDLANGISVKFVGRDMSNIKHTITAGLGLDHHTAASQAYVSKTGASKKDGTRVYPSLEWLRENEDKGSSFGIGAYYSAEYNYHSFGLDMSFSKKNKHNGQFDGKVNAYLDQVKMIYPSELVPASTVVSSASSGGEGKSNIPSSARNTFSASGTFSQVINKRMQASINVDVVEQNGYLGLPFHRVFFIDNSERVENLPSNRLKVPIGLRLNYFAGDRVIIRSYYRFYKDDWGLTAHTAEVEIPVKITPFFSVSPFYRFYTQTAVDYFAAYGKHLATDTYFTSNYALSALTSQYMGAGIKLTPPDGILKTHLTSLELRYGHYTQSTELVSNIISLSMQFK
ncbi:DUF3570 domain-containing protein [Parasediminibacterium sp. JCM 36343]|uniref:DUF3570 domain-containing protein n=1 Tax=Parasediminibacterium sp. JCM 36343 TaxID=3374279 RepID=UPI0039782D94